MNRRTFAALAVAATFAAGSAFAQDAIKAWVWIHGPGGFPPGPELFEGESVVIRIEAPALDLPLKDIYTRVRMDLPLGPTAVCAALLPASRPPRALICTSLVSNASSPAPSSACRW